MLLRRVNSLLRLQGIDLDRAFSVRRWLYFGQNYLELRKQLTASSQQSMTITRLYPCLDDRFQSAGEASGHYFHQDLHVAQRVFANNPRRHGDVGSSVSGLVSHIAAFREIEVFDIRPLLSRSKNIQFRQLDLIKGDERFSEAFDSLSCLHALEHMGLGRYGDSVDANGHLRALENLTRMVSPGGRLYLSVPMGPLRIEFDAHRVFSIESLLEMVSPAFEVAHFSYVDDRGDFFPHVEAELMERGLRSNFDCHYGCAIFELRKK